MLSRVTDVRSDGPPVNAAKEGSALTATPAAEPHAPSGDTVGTLGVWSSKGQLMDNSDVERAPIVLAPGEGRAFPMGRLSAVFKADGAESANRYSISEWWLDPHTKGPGVHQHPEDDLFYVLGGTLHVLVDTDWIEATVGSFVLVPGHFPHDFENRGPEPAGFLNVSVPGGFEPAMPSIADWFLDRSDEDSRA